MIDDEVKTLEETLDWSVEFIEAILLILDFIHHKP